MTILPAPALRAPALWIGPLPGLIAVLALGCAASPPPVFAPQVAPAIASPAPARMKAKAAPLLALGAAVERDLPPGGRDEVSLDLDAGLYLRLGFDGRGAELSMSLSGPGGEVVASEEGDSEGRLAWITTTKGPYRLAVAAPKVKVAFRYQLLLLDQRPRVDPGDGQRLVADRALSAARQEKNAARALEQAQLALKLWRGLGDKDGEFEALDVIKAGDKENAAPWYTLALEQAQATGHLPHQARAQTDLGEALTRGNRLDEARAHLEAALPLWKALGDSYQQSRTLYYLGFGRASNGNLDEAIDFYHRSLALTDPAWDLTPDIRNALCNVYTASGASQRALDCFDQAFKLARDTGRTGTEAAVRTGRGLLHWRRGEARAALGEFGEALALNRSDPELAPYVGRVLVHIGSVELGLGQTEEALGNFQQAYGEFQRGGDDLWTASALVSIGRTELIMEQPEAALATFRKALKIASDNKGLRQEANALQGIGIALLQVHQGPQAIQSLQDALDIQAGIDRPGQALTEQKLGEAYGEGGDLVASRDALQKALQITEDVEAPYARSPILLDLARLERRQGNLPAALERIEGAIRILETVRSDLTDDRLRTSFFASKRSYYDFYVELLMELARRNPAGNYADRALAASEQGRARSLLDLLANSRSELTRGISSELRETEQDVRARLSQIQRQLADELSSHPPRPPVVKELENRRQETENEQQAVELRIKAESPLYAQIRYPSPLQRAEVQKLLRPDEALLEYSTGESETYLFVVTSEGLAVHTLKPTPEQLGDEVGIVRATLESGGRLTNAYRKTARRLYEDLVAPARAEIRGKRRLLIAPDGVLYHLAFEALLDREASAGAGHFLIEDWAVSYVPSASVLSSLSGQRPPAAAGSGAPLKQFIAFAPAYGPAATEDRTRSAGAATEPGSVPASTLPDLEGARQEVAAISRLYPDTELEVYLGAAASRENFKRSDLRTTALHFAGHGLLDEAHPERSSLEFADGPLRVDDIFNLELNANLVVLSACRTAGKVVTGEGLVGLTRAFLYAGAPSVIVTLWQAADTSARDLMVQFYRNLGLSGDKAEALRQAKLSIIEKGRTSGKLDRPYYWAPFILIGKPQ